MTDAAPTNARPGPRSRWLIAVPPVVVALTLAASMLPPRLGSYFVMHGDEALPSLRWGCAAGLLVVACFGRIDLRDRRRLIGATALWLVGLTACVAAQRLWGWYLIEPRGMARLAPTVALGMALLAIALGTRSRFVAVSTIALVLTQAACVESEQRGFELEEEARDANPMLPLVPIERRARVAESDTLFHLLLDHDVVLVGHAPVVGWALYPNGAPQSGAPTALDTNEYRGVRLVVDRVLVGAPQADFGFDVYCTADSEICARLAHLVATPDERATFFFDEVPYYRGGMAVYLSHDTAGVIQSQIDEERVRALVRELDDAEDLLRGALNESVTAAVDEQTGRITDGPIAQYDAMSALLSLGAPAIPAIAQRLDDFRALPSRSIMLENPPAFFEAFGTYCITSVTDALIVILERLSLNGPACDGILNSDEDHTSDDLRRSCIARWRAWTLRGLDEGAFGADWRI